MKKHVVFAFLGSVGLGGGACGSSLQGDLCPLANLDMVREKQRDANCQLKGKKHIMAHHTNHAHVA